MKVVVVGAGYAGARVARQLGLRAQACNSSHRNKSSFVQELSVTLVSETPFHVLKTELHTIAAGTVDDPGDVQIPLSSLFYELPVNLVHGRLEDIRPDENLIRLECGDVIGYDELVLAVGAEPEFYGIGGMAENARTISGIQSALDIRKRVDEVVRRAASSGDGREAHVVVGGGGLTGIEFAGELAWLLQHRYHRSAADQVVRVTVVEAAPTLMPGLPTKLGVWARKRLDREGVEVLLGTSIADVTTNALTLKREGGEELSRPYDLLVWSGGVRGNGLLGSVFATDPKGRVLVDDRFRAKEYLNVRVLGDAACVLGADGRPLPPTAQAAMMQGAWLADALIGDLRANGRSGGSRGSAVMPYMGKSKGILASVGPNYGIGLVGKLPVRGRWVKWLKAANNLRYLASIGALGYRTQKFGRKNRTGSRGGYAGEMRSAPS